VGGRHTGRSERTMNYPRSILRRLSRTGRSDGSAHQRVRRYRPPGPAPIHPVASVSGRKVRCKAVLAPPVPPFVQATTFH
jgi:hypothetical protein